MVTGEARRQQAIDPRPILVVGPDGKHRWSEVWENNPRIVRKPDGEHQRMVNAAGARPYIVSKGARQWKWKPYKPIRGEFYFSLPETHFGKKARGAVVLEPNIKRNTHDNKAWEWGRWLTVAADLKRHHDVVQLAPRGVRLLPGVRWIETPRFRDAAACLSEAAGLVTTEGAMHHAAAAVGLPAVVLYSGFILPEHTGYDMHVNLCRTRTACGMRVRCQHCRLAMSEITVADVMAALQQTMERRNETAGQTV